jgi:hypothetical protein
MQRSLILSRNPDVTLLQSLTLDAYLPQPFSVPTQSQQLMQRKLGLRSAFDIALSG